MLLGIFRQVIDRLSSKGVTPLQGEDVLVLGSLAIHQGFAIAFHEDPALLLSINGAGTADARPSVSTILRRCVDAQMLTTHTLRNRTIDQARERDQPWLSCWFEKDDLLVAVRSHNIKTNADRDREFQEKLRAIEKGPAGKTASQPMTPAPPVHETYLANMLDVIEGKRTSALNHPARLAALAEGKEIAGFEADCLFFTRTETASLPAAFLTVNSTGDALREMMEQRMLEEASARHPLPEQIGASAVDDLDLPPHPPLLAPRTLPSAPKPKPATASPAPASSPTRPMPPRQSTRRLPAQKPNRSDPILRADQLSSLPRHPGPLSRCSRNPPLLPRSPSPGSLAWLDRVQMVRQLERRQVARLLQVQLLADQPLTATPDRTLHAIT